MCERKPDTVIGLSYDASYQSGKLCGGLHQQPPTHASWATTLSCRRATQGRNHSALQSCAAMAHARVAQTRGSPHAPEAPSTRTPMSQLRAPAARADRREGGRHGRPVARTVPPPPETPLRPQLRRLAILPPIAVALSACAAVLFTVRTTGARPTPTL